MADGWVYDKDGSATLRVPFVFIPDGAPQPVDWLAEHPNHIRVPAMFRPPKQPPQSRAPEEGSSGRGGSSSVTDAATMADPVPGYAPIGPQRGRRYPPPPQIDRSGYFQEGPIAAYLRANEIFDRLGIGSSPRLWGDPRLAGNVHDPSIASRPAPDAPLPPGAARGGAPGTAADPTTPVKLRDGHGNPVEIDREPVFRPAGLAPEFFIQKGLEDRQHMEQLMRTSGGAVEGAVAALMCEKDVLRNFRQNGVWDAQRMGGKQHRDFRDYSTIAIGLYAAAAGIPEREILIIQDLYAWGHSSFGAGTVFDRTYGHLPEDNVENTHLGYVLYNSYQTRMNAE